MHGHIVRAETGSGWVRSGSNPVLRPGLPGAWDDEGVSHPCVVKDRSIYKMWFAGYDGSVWRIGYATSNDGVLWTRDVGNPVLAVGQSGSWDESDVGSPWVIKEGSGYRMWYVGRNRAGQSGIGVAASADGVLWTKMGVNPVISQGGLGQPDSRGIGRLCVIGNVSGYTVWFEARGDDGHSRICMASSSDGGTWLRYDRNLDGFVDVVLDRGSVGAWDYYEAADPAVLKSGEVYFMWYAARDASRAGNRRIGMARSTTGKSWDRVLANPVLSTGPPGSWDSYSVDGTVVIQDRLDLKMWYTGWSDVTRPQIGYAENFMRVAGSMGLIDAPERTVYYIYSDYRGAKPAGTFPASVSDWTALGIILSMSSNKQYVTSDTDTSVVNPTTGEIIVSTRYDAVVLGGPGVNGPTRYYEATSRETPAFFKLTGSICCLYSRSTGLPISNTLMMQSAVSTDQDIFIIMAFRQGGTGRDIVIMYGYGWKGSYAAALWLKYGTGEYGFGKTGISHRDKAYYIFKWSDMNGDLAVDLTEISFVASGC